MTENAENMLEGEEWDNYKNLAEDMSRTYTIAPCDFTVLDRVYCLWRFTIFSCFQYYCCTFGPSLYIAPTYYCIVALINEKSISSSNTFYCLGFLVSHTCVVCEALLPWESPIILSPKVLFAFWAFHFTRYCVIVCLLVYSVCWCHLTARTSINLEDDA